MPEIKVQKIGEHVVVTPGRLVIGQGSKTQFWFENTCEGDVEIMFLHPGLLEDAAGNPVKANVFDLKLGHKDSSGKYSLTAGAQAGEYDYLVKFTVSPAMNTVQLRLGNAGVGLAVGGSSPRIIIKPTAT